MPVTSKAERKKSIQKWARWLAVAIPVAAVIIYLLIWYGPDVLARHDIGNVTGPLRVLRLQQARDAARGRLLTLGAGLFAAGALLFTGRNYGVARRTLELTQRTFALTEQGQVTDRYTKAIEQLGSYNKLDVRIGGIYALERVARDSARDHPTVMEVLAAFIREHSHEQWSGPVSERATRPDVQAALTVLGRRNPRHDRQSADLTDSNLTRANLVGADLSGAILLRTALISALLAQANLTDAILLSADLTHAVVGFTDLTGANLGGANLSGADFSGAIAIRASLVGANLSGAGLIDANLTDADLDGANLTHAALVGADLTRANLTRVNLTDTNLNGALLPRDAVVPEGWHRAADSGRLKRADNPGDAAPN